MRAPGWVLVGLVATVATAFADDKAKAGKDPAPLPVDLNPNNEPVLVLKDAGGGTYVVVGDPKAGSKRAFFGTSKQLYEQVTTGGSVNGDQWQVNTWSPRIADIRPGAISRRKDGSYFKSCDGLDDAVLTEVTGDKAKAVLEKSQFLSPGLVRRAHLFARDEMGVYYYVDKLAQRHGGKSFRVFVGKRGAMKQLPLVDIASDSAGMVFSTKTGDLRLVETLRPTPGGAAGQVSTTRDPVWVKGGKKVELVNLDVDVNSPIIFKELGIYKLVGGICDNI